MHASLPASVAWILRAAATLAATAPLTLASGPADPPPVSPFDGRLGQARELSQERNVPLLVAAYYEDESWTAEGHHDEVGMRRELFERREWAQALERGVLVLACNRVHELETVRVERGDETLEVQRCKAYRTPDCATHQRLFEDVFAAWHDDGVLVTPFVLVLRPDGEIRQRWSDQKTPARDDLLAAVAAVRKAVGEGLSAAELQTARGLEADARQAAERGRDGDAWRAWQELLALNAATPGAARAREGIAAASARVEARRAAAREELAAGRAIPAWTALDALRQECAGLAVERELAGEVRAIEKDPAHKEAIRAHVHELEAAELLEEIDALVRAGESRKAKARCGKLLRSYADTRAAAEARERHAALID